MKNKFRNYCKYCVNWGNVALTIAIIALLAVLLIGNAHIKEATHGTYNIITYLFA